VSDTSQALDGFVAAAAAGDRDAFTRLVDASSGMVSSIALAILRDADQSRDVAQEVFLAAWTGLRRLRNPASFLPWLRETTRHRAYDALRSRGRARRTLADAGDDEALAAIADPRPDASRVLLQDEERLLLQQGLDALPDETREVLVLFYREERSARQVAALLEISEEAVRQRLSRARAALRADVLDRLGRTLQRTTPSRAFTGAVLLALPAAAPGAVAAGTLAVASERPREGTSVTPQLVGAGLAAAAAVAAILIGVRRHRSVVMDPRERRSMRRLAAVTGALAVTSFAAMVASDQPYRSVAIFAAFVAGLAVQRFVWLPRIQAPRLAAELLADPSAAARHARLDRIGTICWLLGVLAGSAGVVYGILSS
jgi:RNA polymerase sigma factor (sigma-70 family)